MARATALSTGVTLLSTRLFDSSLSPASNLSFSHQILHFNHQNSLYRNSRVRICYGQSDGSVGKEHDDIDQVFFDGDDVIDEESDEDETESSVDLLIRFLQSMLNKVSKRAKKASRSVLPNALSPELVSFAVDGILLLASLSIVKALLEVICSLGGTVFVVILLLRVVWAATSYFQMSENNNYQSGSSFGPSQPVT